MWWMSMHFDCGPACCHFLCCCCCFMALHFKLLLPAWPLGRRIYFGSPSVIPSRHPPFGFRSVIVYTQDTKKEVGKCTPPVAAAAPRKSLWDIIETSRLARCTSRDRKFWGAGENGAKAAGGKSDIWQADVVAFLLFVALPDAASQF